MMPPGHYSRVVHNVNAMYRDQGINGEGLQHYYALPHEYSELGAIIKIMAYCEAIKGCCLPGNGSISIRYNAQPRTAHFVCRPQTPLVVDAFLLLSYF